jgi:hypothetical protein
VSSAGRRNDEPDATDAIAPDLYDSRAAVVIGIMTTNPPAPVTPQPATTTRPSQTAATEVTIELVSRAQGGDRSALDELLGHDPRGDDGRKEVQDDRMAVLAV